MLVSQTVEVAISLRSISKIGGSTLQYVIYLNRGQYPKDLRREENIYYIMRFFPNEIVQRQNCHLSWLTTSYLMKSKALNRAMCPPTAQPKYGSDIIFRKLSIFGVLPSRAVTPPGQCARDQESGTEPHHISAMSPMTLRLLETLIQSRDRQMLSIDMII